MTQRIAAGALLMVLFKFLERSLGLISTLILARLLLPKDFGIVAMGMSLIALIELFSAFGLDSALIQRRDVTREHYNTAWTFNVMAGCLVGLLMAAAAVPASHFYREPNLVLVIIALGVSSAIQSLENVGVVDFRRNLQFDREFRYMLTKKVVGFAIAIPLAFLLRNYWALVIGTLASRVVILGYSYVAHPFRPRFSLAASADLMHFSKWMVASNLVAFLRERPADFIIGRISGPQSLGIFSIAAQLASMPSTELVAPINRALLPAYARLASDPVALGRQYLSVMGVIALLAVPAVAGLAATAPFVILLVLGPKWREAIAVLEVLAFFGITQVLQTNAYSAFLALGKPDVFVRINAFHVVALLISLFVLTPPYGMYGAAWAFVISALIALPVNFVIITRFLGLRLLDLVTAVWRPLVSAGIMYLVVRFGGPAGDNLETSGDAFVPLVIAVLLGVVVYLGASGLLWLMGGRPDGAESWVLGQAREILGRARQALPWRQAG
jgi:O-antigen/teichoic acid export membrane protein